MPHNTFCVVALSVLAMGTAWASSQINRSPVELQGATSGR
jgi:hypothetical protein